MNLAIDTDTYTNLLVQFQPKVIESEEDYRKARHIISDLMKKTDRSFEETAFLKLIVTLVKDFENKQEKPEPASPHEVLLHLMEAHNMKQADLVGKIGSKGVVSEIINKKRSISKSQTKILGEIFSVSPAVFI